MSSQIEFMEKLLIEKTQLQRKIKGIDNVLFHYQNKKPDEPVSDFDFYKSLSMMNRKKVRVFLAKKHGMKENNVYQFLRRHKIPGSKEFHKYIKSLK